MENSSEKYVKSLNKNKYNKIHPQNHEILMIQTNSFEIIALEQSLFP